MVTADFRDAPPPSGPPAPVQPPPPPDTIKTWKEDLHASGVHIECRLAKRWAGSKRIGDGTWQQCPRAGTVERLHAHDFDGPLVCGCPDFGTF